MIERLQQNQRMSMIVKWPLSGQMIALSGQVPDNHDAGVTDQTANVLAKIDRLLAEAGVTKQDITSAQIWLSDITTFDEMNAAWDAWVAPGYAPARACVEGRLAHPSLKVEIQVFAVKA